MSTSVLPIALGSQNPARRRFLVLAVAFLLAITSLAILAEPASAKKANPPGQLVHLQLLAFNDYHGHLEATGNGSCSRWRPSWWRRISVGEAQ